MSDAPFRETDPIAAAADESLRLPVGAGPRRGVARIDTNDGGGDYTVTEQRYDAATEAWRDAAAPLGYVQVEARDVRGRSHGPPDRIVPFAVQRDLGGREAVWIDLAPDDEKVRVSTDDATAGHLAAKLVGDDGTGGNLRVSLVEQNDGGEETLKVVVARSDVAEAAGDAFVRGMAFALHYKGDADAVAVLDDTIDWRDRLVHAAAVVDADPDANAVGGLYGGDDTPWDAWWGLGTHVGATPFPEITLFADSVPAYTSGHLFVSDGTDPGASAGDLCLLVRNLSGGLTTEYRIALLATYGDRFGAAGDFTPVGNGH